MANGNGSRGDVNETRYVAALRGDPCAYCGGQSDFLGHVVPKCHGGDDDWSNLVAVCRPCYSAKSGRSLLSFLGGRRWRAAFDYADQFRSWWAAVGA